MLRIFVICGNLKSIIPQLFRFIRQEEIMPQECHWCFNCRMKFYRNEIRYFDFGVREANTKKGVCSACKAAIVASPTFIDTNFQFIFIPQQLLLTKLGMKNDKLTKFYLLLNKYLPYFPTKMIGHVIQLCSEYNSKFMRYIQSLDLDYQTSPHYPDSVDLGHAGTHLINWRGLRKQMEHLIEMTHHISENKKTKADDLKSKMFEEYKEIKQKLAADQAVPVEFK